MRLIDADALMKTLGITDMDCEKCAWRDKTFPVCNRGEGFPDACSAIEDAPTIEERKKGEWIDYTEDGYVECPFCHSATNCDENKDELHYCFSCGADMRGEEDGR